MATGTRPTTSPRRRYLRAWDAREDIADARHLRRWCYRVARCKAVTWARKRKAHGRRMESLERLAEVEARARERPGPDDHPEPPGAEMVGALRRALKRLPSNYAGPVHLYYVHGCSTREAAELLGIRRATVKMRLHRARAFLRREIDEDDAQSGAEQASQSESPP